MKVMYLIKSDLARLTEPSVASFFRWYFFPQGSCFPYQVWSRIVHSVKKNRGVKYTIGLIAYWNYYRLGHKYGVSINPDMEIGPGLKIVHSYGTILNCKKIGSNFTVYQNVTLGSDTKGGVPTVEDNVTVYIGSVVVGNIVLNNGCVVGCNSYVHRNVNQNDIVAGSPARSIRKTW